MIKPKQFKFIAVAIILAAVVALVYFNYDFIIASGKPPIVPPQDVDTDGDGVPDTQISFSFYQALRVVNKDGTDAWKYPQARTTLLPMTIIDVSTQKEVTATQAYVFFNLASEKIVAQVIFTAQMKVSIYNADKTIFREMPEQSLTQTIASPQNAVDVYITSATITANDIGDMLNSYDLAQPKTYYWVISVRDISASVTFSDGNTKTFTATGVQSTENQLWWQFYHRGPDASGIEQSIINYGSWSGWT